MFYLGGFSLLFAIALCVHVVRTGREMYWLYIILFIPTLGGLVYLIAVVLPEMFGGSTARRVGQAARAALDPNRAYREAKLACDDTPTVNNRMRLAQAAASMGRYDEAEGLFADAAQGIHADDPTLLLGRANALIELGRPEDAMPLLDKLGEDEAHGRTAVTALALGRALEGLGRMTEADTAYQWAASRLPGLEGISRYTAFLAHTGRTAEAKEALAEIDKRLAKANPQFRKEGRLWRDLAAGALAGQ